MMFPPGARVRFLTTRGERVGTVLMTHGALLADGDEVYSVRPDDGDFPVMLLLGRSLELLEDSPFIVLV